MVRVWTSKICTANGTNNYLGLATDAEVIAAAREATEKFGTGAGSSRLVAGRVWRCIMSWRWALAKLKPGRTGGAGLYDGFCGESGGADDVCRGGGFDCVGQAQSCELAGWGEVFRGAASDLSTSEGGAGGGVSCRARARGMREARRGGSFW